MNDFVAVSSETKASKYAWYRYRGDTVKRFSRVVRGKETRVTLNPGDVFGVRDVVVRSTKQKAVQIVFKSQGLNALFNVTTARAKLLLNQSRASAMPAIFKNAAIVSESGRGVDPTKPKIKKSRATSEQDAAKQSPVKQSPVKPGAVVKPFTEMLVGSGWTVKDSKGRGAGASRVFDFGGFLTLELDAVSDQPRFKITTNIAIPELKMHSAGHTEEYTIKPDDLAATMRPVKRDFWVDWAKPLEPRNTRDRLEPGDVGSAQNRLASVWGGFICKNILQAYRLALEYNKGCPEKDWEVYYNDITGAHYVFSQTKLKADPVAERGRFVRSALSDADILSFIGKYNWSKDERSRYSFLYRMWEEFELTKSGDPYTVKSVTSRLSLKENHLTRALFNLYIKEDVLPVKVTAVKGLRGLVAGAIDRLRGQAKG